MTYSYSIPTKLAMLAVTLSAYAVVVGITYEVMMAYVGNSSELFQLGGVIAGVVVAAVVIRYVWPFPILTHAVVDVWDDIAAAIDWKQVWFAVVYWFALIVGTVVFGVGFVLLANVPPPLAALLAISFLFFMGYTIPYVRKYI